MVGKTVLVAGASGLVGYAAVRHFASEGTQVHALSRRKPLDLHGADFVAADLKDREGARAAIAPLSEVTHLVYAALYEKPGLIAGWFEDDQIDANDAMFRNCLDPLLETAKGLRHITLLQGTKAYGIRRPTPVAAEEHVDEAHHEPNFYWRQENYLTERRAGAAWRTTILRPQIIYGVSVGSAMNLIPALGVYGAILKARGEPLHFPGPETGMIQEAVDADMLARVIGWAGEAAAAQDDIFNVANGDVYTWRSVWPTIAAALAMEVGEDRPLSFAQNAPAWAPEWDAIRHRHALAAPDLASFIGESFHYADMLLRFGADDGGPRRAPAVLSTLRLRRAGFGELVHTKTMFTRILQECQARRLLPPA
jgi:nucleoside-diphosphate-sugar epimerase